MLALALIATSFAGEATPFADVHQHYNWDQQEVTSPTEALERLVENNVVLAIVSGTPPKLALSLRQAGGDWILPLYSPHREPRSWSSWLNDDSLPARTRQALESGEYFGIGEVHLIPGFGQHWDTPVFGALAELAAEFDVPMLIHTEASIPGFFIDICTRYPRVRFLWAHAGGLLAGLPPDVEERVRLTNALRFFNLETAVGRGLACVTFVAWQGTTPSNSRLLRVV